MLHLVIEEADMLSEGRDAANTNKIVIWIIQAYYSKNKSSKNWASPDSGRGLESSRFLAVSAAVDDLDGDRPYENKETAS